MTRPPDDDGAGEGRLSGWSRRKLASRREAAPASPEEVAPAAAEPEEVDEEYIAALPPIGTIIAGTDIKPFLARGVPAGLRNAALRRLWSATPGLRENTDPAVDYAWDWNAPGGVPGGGGTLSESGVAKMVKDLIGKLQADEDEEGRAPDAPGPREAEPDPRTPEKMAVAKAPDAGAPPSAVRRPDAGLAPEREEHPERPAGRDGARVSAISIAPPRRHGGAVPD